MFNRKRGVLVKMVLAIAVFVLLTGGCGKIKWFSRKESQKQDKSSEKETHSKREKETRSTREEEGLPRNPELTLAEGVHGIELIPDELPSSLLVIDVEKSGRVSIPDIGVVSDEKLAKMVRKRVNKYGRDFPCMIRADKDTPHRYVKKVMDRCAMEGACEFSFVASLPQSEDGREPGFSALSVMYPSSEEDGLRMAEVPEEAPPPEDQPMLEIKPMSEEAPAEYLSLEELTEIALPPDEDVEVDVEAEVALQLETPSLSLEDLAVLVPPPAEQPCGQDASIDAMSKVKSPVKMRSVQGVARNAGPRNMLVGGGSVYGDANTERAVKKALRWLKATQSPDGSWGTKPELGLTRGMDKAAGAGFAVLTFLAHGETPASKEFGPTVEKAITYLIDNVYVVKDKFGREAKDPNGITPYIKMRGASGSEYGFLIGTYALCEAYAMTKNPNARAAAEKALARIISGQSPTGGWNYNMKRVSPEGIPDDLSFGGWAMQALKAGKMAGIHLPGMDECIKKAVKCLQTRNYSEKAGFVYRATTNHKGGGGGLGGVGCLAMQLLGYSKEPQVANALRVMTDWAPTFDKKHMSGGASSQYYSYYASQCKYQAGMAKNATPANLTLWKKWNAEMKALYPKSIIKVMDQKTNQPYTIPDPEGKPREIGYWKNNDSLNMDRYHVMSTCLVALQLMVYYRYLPTTQLKATEVEADVESLSKDKSEINVTIDI